MRKRARRRSFFKASLFSDPAWDILLELFAADEEGRAVSISAAGRAAAIPLTTAIRWINVLQQEGLIQREDDPFHGRRSYLLLTEAGLRAMREYFLSCGDVVAARGAF
jgi:DNA-binding MarR family transcriptional regulator